jgi:5-hydroxyisourate hydrolase-like protein (transthyretin family)
VQGNEKALTVKGLRSGFACTDRDGRPYMAQPDFENATALYDVWTELRENFQSSSRNLRDRYLHSISITLHMYRLSTEFHLESLFS